MYNTSRTRWSIGGESSSLQALVLYTTYYKTSPKSTVVPDLNTFPPRDIYIVFLVFLFSLIYFFFFFSFTYISFLIFSSSSSFLRLLSY